jgi:Cu(I)/Ag(I) efflux system membrane fusion protein
LKWSFFMQNNNKKLGAVGGLALALGLFLGMGLGGDNERPINNAIVEKKAEVWTCSMHPQIRLPTEGQCPICAMDLIPVAGEAEAEGMGARELKLSARAQKLAAIQTVKVERRFVPVETRMVGKIAVDETRLRDIAAWVPGRIDRLYVDYTGVQVNKGDHMVYLYSPELLTAQQELLQALRAQEQLGGNGVMTLRQTAKATVESVREKLKLWGLTPQQVAEIERARKPSDHLTIYAPASGVVVERHVGQGAYVQTGARIYTIADLSQVWLELAAYESDLAWIHYGQEVEFSTEAYSSESFVGRIAFIAPLLDEKTRTVRVRVNVDNADGRLKPGMLARAVSRAHATADGRVMDDSLAGKWISPMHPEIVKDGPGACDICGMALVPAEELGYMDHETAARERPLVIPASAALITGKRAVVYVALPGRGGVFAGREVELGPRAGDFYLIKSGLREGEQVVVNGAFKIDSALQILAKPSMMSPEGGVKPAGHQHGGAETQTRSSAVEESVDHSDHAHAREGAGPSESGTEAGYAADDDPRTVNTAIDHSAHESVAKGVGHAVTPLFLEQLAAVFTAYIHVQEGLSHDQLGAAQTGAEQVLAALKKVDMQQVEGEAHVQWMRSAEDIDQSASLLRDADKIAAARAAFEALSTALASVAEGVGTGVAEPLYQYHCPMALDNKGATWLQVAEQVENPYLGSAMFRCGTRQQRFAGAGE